MGKKYLIFLGGGRWQLHGIKTAKLMGISILVVDGDSKAIGFNYADIKLHIDFYSKVDSVLSWLQDNKISLLGVLSYCNERGMELAAIIREKYNLHGIGIKQSRIMINKGYQREIWSDKNIPCPKWKVFKSKNIDIMKLISTFSYPFIIKPTQSAGSRGISVVNNFNEINVAIDNAFSSSSNEEIIVEDFFRGDEYTVESMTFDGKTEILAVTKKLKVDGTNNTVANVLESVDFKSENFKMLSALAIKALKALNYNHGPGHTEILYNKSNDEKVLVETAGRGGGFKVFESLVPAISKVNVTKILIMQAIGLKFKTPLKIFNNYGIIKFFTGHKGRIRLIQGFDKIKSKDNLLLEGCSFVEVGDYITDSPKTDGDRLGYLMASGSFKSDVKTYFNKVFNEIKFEYE